MISVLFVFSCGRENKEKTFVISSGVKDIPTGLKAKVREALPDTGFNLWIPGSSFRSSSLARVPRYPKEINKMQNQKLELEGARNEQISAQLAVISTESIKNLQVLVSNLTSESGASLLSESVQVRFVRYIPVVEAHSHCYRGSQIEEVADKGISGNRNPDLVGDPLLEFKSIDVPAYCAQPVWFTYKIPKSASPGIYKGIITILRENAQPEELEIMLTIQDIEIPDPEDYDFFLDIWFNYSAIAGYYEIEPWSKKHWELLTMYMKDLVSRGEKVIQTVITEEPWPMDSWFGEDRPQTTQFGYESLVKWRFDGENWLFDYTIFDKYVSTALAEGMGPWITVYSLLPFRGQPHFIYMDDRIGEIVRVKTELGSDHWKDVWSIFLKDFSAHLQKKDWFKHTFLAFDERPPELMDIVINFIKENIPELTERLFVAGTPDVEPYSSKYFSLAYEYLPGESRAPIGIERLLNNRKGADKITVYYTCCGPAHPNNFTISPAIEARMLPWISAKHHLDGYLRWAYCSWPENVFESPVFKYIIGDEYQIYPGPHGPISSIRWELLKDGIEDYELITMLRKKLKAVGNEHLQQAIELAVRNTDGREKDISDIIKARDLIVRELLSN